MELEHATAPRILRAGRGVPTVAALATLLGVFTVQFSTWRFVA